MNRTTQWLVISTVVSKTKDFWRSQPVTYIVNVVISRKRGPIASLWLQTTSKKWYVTYRIEMIPTTFEVIPTASLSNVIYHTALQQFTIFQLTYRVARSLCDSRKATMFANSTLQFITHVQNVHHQFEHLPTVCSWSSRTASLIESCVNSYRTDCMTSFSSFTLFSVGIKVW